MPPRVHLHPALVRPDELAGGVVIVIDALRASVTLAAALHAACPFVVPTRTVEDARAAAAALAPQAVLLGGERHAVLIPGFDLDNSPRGYTVQRIAGRPLVFTTTNGTNGLLHAAAAAQILLGSFANLSAVCAAAAADPRPLHILCCGTGPEVTFEDVLVAGAIVERMGAPQGLDDDSARLARAAWMGAREDVPAALRASRGGRNLIAAGLGADVDFCARIDTYTIVPRFDPRTNRITAR